MTPEQTSFISSVAQAAIESEKATGIPAAITIAQAILESGWGKTKLASLHNNFFGIKANKAQLADHKYIEFSTEEEINHTLETLKQDFAVYDSFLDCFTAHANLLLSPHYAAAMAVISDLDEFAYMLGPKSLAHPAACGYSTLSGYHDRLLQMVNLYNLKDYHA